jgi:hypothetical protein
VLSPSELKKKVALIFEECQKKTEQVRYLERLLVEKRHNENEYIADILQKYSAALIAKDNLEIKLNSL